MMNVIDFIRETAIFMAKDRPDVYTQDTAAMELSDAIEYLRSADGVYGCALFATYMLSRVEEDGVEEFLFTRKVSSVIVCEEEEGCITYSYVDDVALPSIFDEQFDLDDDDETW